MPRAKSSLARMKRRGTVQQLHFAGSTYREIAEALNVSHTTVKNDIKWLRDEWRKEGIASVDTEMLLDVARTNQLVTALWNYAMAGNVEAVREVANIIKLRSRLIGYDGLPRALYDIENKMPDQPDVSVVNIYNPSGQMPADEAKQILANLALAAGVSE